MFLLETYFILKPYEQEFPWILNTFVRVPILSFGEFVFDTNQPADTSARNTPVLAEQKPVWLETNLLNKFC